MNPIILQIPQLITNYFNLPKKVEENKETKVDPIVDTVEIRNECRKN